MADIESMFHPVYVNPNDIDALQLLWWPENDFMQGTGRTSDDGTSLRRNIISKLRQLCLTVTADDNQNYFSKQAVESIKRNFYVDDCLETVSTESRAIRLVGELRQLLSKSGFPLTKWISNSRNLNDSVPESERTSSAKDLLLDQLPIERTLGVRWNVESDTLSFKIVVKDRPTARRGLPSIASSVYDPLGFAAPFTLPAKGLLQDLCRMNLGWDDPISNEDLALPKLEKLKVDPGFKPSSFGVIVSSQLQHLADASQRAYGAVSHLRIANAEGKIHSSFVIGKSRLSLLKQLTIPRPELSAAVVATRLDNMVRKEIDIPMNKSSGRIARASLVTLPTKTWPITSQRYKK